MSREQGFNAEKIAGQHIKQHGLTLLARNYQCKMGEIDLIAVDQQTLVFIEVKARRNNQHGHPSEFVTLAKQRKIIKTAEHFLQKQPRYQQAPCRFDVISVQGDQIQADDWLIDAFQVPY